MHAGLGTRVKFNAMQTQPRLAGKQRLRPCAGLAHHQQPTAGGGQDGSRPAPRSQHCKKSGCSIQLPQHSKTQTIIGPLLDIPTPCVRGRLRQASTLFDDLHTRVELARAAKSNDDDTPDIPYYTTAGDRHTPEKGVFICTAVDHTTSAKQVTHHKYHGKMGHSCLYHHRV